MSIKIDVLELEKLNNSPDENISSFFGDWIGNLDDIKKQYKNVFPVENVIIDNFLNSNIAEEISELFPTNLDDYHFYNNPIEVKYAHDNIDKLNSKIRKIFYLLSTKYMENIFSTITDIEMEHDPYLHGAGLHMHPKDGRLGIHLDYEIHPYSGKQRNLNIILYLSKEWDESWGGHTEIWNSDVSEIIFKSKVNFNSAIIFKTNEISWHGVSSKIKCPEKIYRKTLAYYYMSDKSDNPSKDKIGNDGSGYRKKATFVTKPDEENKNLIEPFLKIRPLRRIEKSDIDEFWPEWNSKNF
jgi:Rps23 Pro-64 3,4-dihydroxylase Tpa1-like proline 4-hydroxylase